MYLDNKKELDANEKIVHEAFELARGNRTTELSGQSLAELEHPPVEIGPRDDNGSILIRKSYRSADVNRTAKAEEMV